VSVTIVHLFLSWLEKEQLFFCFDMVLIRVHQEQEEKREMLGDLEYR